MDGTMNFFSRLALLIALMAVVAWFDWRRYAAAATKWREYSFLLLAGILGGIVGMSLDNATATLSPHFYTLGKGLSAEKDFRWQVTEFGLHAGMVAGLLIGGIYLIANNPRSNRPGLPYRRLLKFAVYPILGIAIVVPMTTPLVCYADPLALKGDLSYILSPPQLQAFLAVWGINIGVYLGGILGIIWGVVHIRKARGRSNFLCQNVKTQ
jgi:hypothetical protein